MNENNRRDGMCFIISFICLLSMFIFPDATRNAAEEALHICVKSIIPSLFPFVVCTRILLHYIPFKNSVNSSGRLFCGLNVNGMIVFILGLISGLPTGAVLALKMYERNAVSLSQARRIAIYSSVVSPAFCIIYFGNSVMKNTLCGVAVYISVVVTSIGIMLTEYCLFGKNEADNTYFDFQKDIEARKETFTDVIVNSFMGLLNICAFVMFFMCIGEVSSLIIGFIRGSSRTADALICGILEFSGGISKLSALKFGERFVYGAFLLGFGGASAIMQVMDFCASLGIRVRRLLIVRLVSALCVPVVSVGVIYIIRSVSDFFKESMLSCLTTILILTAIVLTFVIFIVEKSRKNIRKANIISKI